jgi:4'-phosphopantetheinyl transferase
MPNNFIPQQHVTIWHLDPARVTATKCIETLKSWLSHTETERMKRFHHTKHQLAFLVSHALKRVALANVLGLDPTELEFGLGSHGRPFLMGKALNRLQFNLSHTDGLVALAVSFNTYVGLDVESLTRKVPETAFAARFFTPAEHDDILAHEHMPNSHRLLEYWTLKEAYIKAEGLGISIGLDTFYFDLSQTQPQIQYTSEARPPSHPWQFIQLKPTPLHLMALAWAPMTEQVESVLIHDASQIQTPPCAISFDVRAADTLLNIC